MSNLPLRFREEDFEGCRLGPGSELLLRSSSIGIILQQSLNVSFLTMT